MIDQLNLSIENLPSTSPITIKKLKNIDIKTFWQLLNYFPFRYENFSLISSISRLQPGEIITVIGEIKEVRNEITRKGLKIQKVRISDKSGEITLVWYNQPYLIRILKPKKIIVVSGLVKEFGRYLIIEPQEYEFYQDKNNLKHTGRIIPIYPEKKGLSSKTIREKIYYLINLIGNLDLEFLPKEILLFNQLIDEKKAYKNIHFPENKTLAKEAKERLAFDELFVIQLSANLIKKQWGKETVGNQFTINFAIKEKLNQFISRLPFKLTNAQKRVWQEILNDLVKPKPMNRLLQGDVGSGKTVISCLAAYLAYLNGYQTLIMAPTEILASQHYLTLTSILSHVNIKIGLQTGSKKITDKDNLVIEDYDIIIGTHALINEKINFKKVGLVVIDEQHRFGVRQRALLKEKGINPHLLTMTATPIPRTIALTLYGELDISIIDEMPKGRLPVKTYLVPNEKREKGYQWIKQKINETNGQVFVICPLIEESEIETMKSVKAATIEYEKLKKIFSPYKVGLLHGKIRPKEKDKILSDFKNKKFEILVSTPVVEVGIDIPNAIIMIIEGADRFGLAQLHQLRGRIGRGDKQAYCFLFTEKNDEGTYKRLQFFAKNNNGLKLAEFDLKHRGPGEIYGTKQHGMINLKVASFTDYRLIEKTKRAVNYFLNHYNLDDYPLLKKRVEEYNIQQITRD
ncbi:MAG: ATP-dependent DNA helicase RecG [Microgenomates group bacterium]